MEHHGAFASASRWRSLIVPDGVRRQKKAGGASRARSLLDMMSDRFAVGHLGRPSLSSIRPRCVAPQRVRVRPKSGPACGARIWLVDQVVAPLSAQLELAVMGMPGQRVARSSLGDSSALSWMTGRFLTDSRKRRGRLLDNRGRKTTATAPTNTTSHTEPHRQTTLEFLIRDSSPPASPAPSSPRPC